MMLDADIAPTGDDDRLQVQATRMTYRPEFSGRTAEYFGIWFVNLLLSIVTLGIYSAWAKVRTERYFYGNTRLAGASFEYLAPPISILKGRLIAYSVAIALAVSAKFAPILYLLLLIPILLLIPALIAWSLRFRARNSAWRGVGFHFDKRAGEAYPPFMFWGWLVGLTATLVYPFMKQRQHAFVVDGHRYGTTRFHHVADMGAYYVPYAIAAGTGITLFTGFMIVTFAAIAGAGAESAKEPSVAVFAMMLLFYAGFFVIGTFLRARYTNLMWNGTSLGPHRFKSTLRARDMIWLYASNVIAIICTLGLAVPWAMVRLARYRAEHFALEANGDIEDFIADQERQRGASSAELMDVLDVGLDIGL